MTYLGGPISRERQREMLARQAPREGGKARRPRRAWRAALRLARLGPPHRAAR